MTRSELSLTRAILRSAELGFLGLVMVTRRHTPFMHGRLPSESAGDTGLRARCFLRHPRITWPNVAQRRASGATTGASDATVGMRSMLGDIMGAAEGAARRGSARKAVRRANMADCGVRRCGCCGGGVLRG